MNADEVLALLLAEPEAYLGATAIDRPDIQRARRLNIRFRECCHSNTPDYPHKEYIAATDRDPLYISLNLRTRMITCGREGYHWTHDYPASCV